MTAITIHLNITGDSNLCSNGYEERRKVGTWHTDKKIIIGLIVAVLGTFITSLGQWFYVIKTLDTDPPLINRIIALEYHVSEHGRVNRQILDEIREARRVRTKFLGEQARRTPMVDWIEKKMGDGS